MSEETLDVEALACRIADDWVADWMMGGDWYGYPDGLTEEAEAFEEYLPTAREEALAIVALLRGQS